MAVASLRSLLTGAIDYAGMFPPCSLDLPSAIEKHAGYARDPDSWMLSAFVLPVAQFEPAEEYLALFDFKHPFRISALGPKTSTASEFGAAFGGSSGMIRAFSKKYADFTSIEQLEMAIPEGMNVKDLDAIAGDLNLRIFWEAPANAAPETIAQLAGSVFGFKLRTGGVTADAFPASSQIAKALVAAVKHRVPIKFTAGLHHPIRQYRDEVKTKMHGFLNVFGAAVLAFEHGWDEKQTMEMIEDEDARTFVFEEEAFVWRGWKINTNRIEAHRKFVASFGSCSVDEPREDLRSLKLL